jgi:hypothetical protein
MAHSHDPFHSPKQRLSRANDHIRRLHKRIETFIKKAPCHRVIELDTDGVTKLHKFKFTKRIPDSCTHSAAEALEALRSALDQIGYAAAVASGKVAPKKTQFPIGDDIDGLADVIKRKVANDLPAEILALFVSFKPYKGGNDPVWALNKLRNATHTTLIPVALASGGMFVSNAVLRGSAEILNPIIWDSGKNEIVFARVPPGGELNYNVHFAFKVALGEIDLVARHQVVAVLRTMATVVKSILVATEAECRRLGFIK